MIRPTLTNFKLNIISHFYKLNVSEGKIKFWKVSVFQTGDCMKYIFLNEHYRQLLIIMLKYHFQLSFVKLHVVLLYFPPLSPWSKLQSRILDVDWSQSATLPGRSGLTNIVFVLIALIDKVRRGNNTISAPGWPGQLSMMKINYSMQTL